MLSRVVESGGGEWLMPTFTTRLADGWVRALDNLPLVLVPTLLAFIQTDSLRAVLAHEGFHLGFKLGLPASVVTVWQFVDPPSTGASVNTGLPLSVPFTVVLIPVAILLRASLSAGYFGVISARLVGRDDSFRASVRDSFLPFLAMVTLPYLVIGPLSLGLFGFGSLGSGGSLVGIVTVLLPLFLAVGYLFWATPYLIVLRQTGLLAAARGSYALADNGGPYVTYTLGYMGTVLIVSPFASVLVVSTPLGGLPVGVVAGGLLGLALNITTMRFVADIDPESPSAGEWADRRAGDRTVAS